MRYWKLADSVTNIEDWIENQAREVLSVARKRKITHADATDLTVPKGINANHRLRIIKKALDLFLAEKVAEAQTVTRRAS